MPAGRGRQAALPGAPAIVTNPPEADREFARWPSVHDPRPTVQSAAQAALAQDDANVPYDDGAALVGADDRGVVADLTARDLGDTVRWRAADVTTDVEVAEFLRHGWRSAAGIDRWAERLIGYALAMVESDVHRRRLAGAA